MKPSFIEVVGIPDFDADGFEPDAIQARALKTWRDQDCPEGQLVHAIMGLAGEAGELLDKVKKGLFKDGYELDPETVKDEAGDVLFYLAILTSLMGLTFEDLSRLNRAKLEGGGHGWREHEAEDMVTFTPDEAEKRIIEAVASPLLGPAQFNAVVMGVLKGLEAHINADVELEFQDEIFRGGYTMAVRPKGAVEILFSVFLPRNRVLNIQRT